MDSPDISIIIPTYNRPDRLSRLLDCLTGQSFPASRLEVIAVDDGSQVDYASVSERAWNFAFKFLCQENNGEAIARNLGVANSQCDLLVFLDDDMIIEPDYLSSVHRAYLSHPDTILIGNMDIDCRDCPTIFQRVIAQSYPPQTFGEVHFTSILAGVMAMPRQIYLAVGGMRPSPDEKRGGWIDMEFAYRAHLYGASFFRVKEAVAHHDDYASKNLPAACKRAYGTSRLAVHLFNTYPALRAEIPMFADKMPIDGKHDTIALIMRKFLRGVSASPVIMMILERMIHLFEVYYPNPLFLSPLYRWITGAYIYRGFRAGLRDYGPLTG